MKRYFNVNYSCGGGNYSANIAHAESEADVREYYQKEFPDSKIIISDCPEWSLEENRRKGMPFVEVPSLENVSVEVYEDNGGGIHAIVLIDGKITNVLPNLDEGKLRGLEFITEAKTGFDGADDYNPENFNGLSLDEIAAEISEHEYGASDYPELVAEITPVSVKLYSEKMGAAAREIFGISDNYMRSPEENAALTMKSWEEKIKQRREKSEASNDAPEKDKGETQHDR